MADVLEHAERWECVTCGHEWERAPEPEVEKARVVKDAHGNVLATGDIMSYGNRYVTIDYPNGGSIDGIIAAVEKLSRKLREGIGGVALNDHERRWP